MTDEQIEVVRAILAAGRLCVGWDDPNGPLRRIVSVEQRNGAACIVFGDGKWRYCDVDVEPVDIVAYFRPFAEL